MKQGIIFFLSFFVSDSFFSQLLDSGRVTAKTAIYISPSSFQRNEPTLVIDKDSNEQLFFSFPVGLENIKVIKTGSYNNKNLEGFVHKRNKEKILFKFKLGSLYAYCKNGICYRYYAEPKNRRLLDGYYKIEDSGSIFIYSKRKQNYRFSTLHYYYSISLRSAIKPLSIKSLGEDFGDKPEIISKIKSNDILMRDVSTRNPDGTFLINNIIKNAEK